MGTKEQGINRRQRHGIMVKEDTRKTVVLFSRWKLVQIKARLRRTPVQRSLRIKSKCLSELMLDTYHYITNK